MTTELHASTQKLIQEIEKKDRRFRIAQSIFMTLLILGFVAGGFFGAQAFQNQQKQREKETQGVIDQINKRLDGQSEQLRCIVQFFTIEDRQNLAIKSVDDCFTTKRTSLAEPQEGEQSLNFTQAPSEPLNLSMPGLEPVQPTQPEKPRPTPSEPEPVKVLGIPVCVPFTNVCVRQ